MTDRQDRGLLSLRIGPARFGLWVDEVLEIVETPPISRLPLSAAEVAGVVSVRGDIIPVLDLGVRLLDRAAVRPGRIVLVRAPESQAILGLLVDGVDTLLGVGPDDLQEAPPEAEAELPDGFVTGVVSGDGGVVTVLDIGAVTAPPVDPDEEG